MGERRIGQLQEIIGTQIESRLCGKMEKWNGLWPGIGIFRQQTEGRLRNQEQDTVSNCTTHSCRQNGSLGTVYVSQTTEADDDKM
jgi:hypothetical protein